MARDTVVSWKTFAIFVLFPITLLVILWLYFRGRRQSRQTVSPSKN